MTLSPSIASGEWPVEGGDLFDGGAAAAGQDDDCVAGPDTPVAAGEPANHGSRRRAVRHIGLGNERVRRRG